MSSTPQTSPPQPTPASPWWRHPMMWLVVGGPVLVVVAAIVTAVIAVRGADPVIDTRAERADRADRTAIGGAEQPAVQARNHAATPPARP